MKKLAAISCILCLWGGAGWAAEPQEEEIDSMIVIGDAVSSPATPHTTRYGTQYNVVGEDQIKQQNSLDFLSTMRNVPGVMFQSKNLMGSQTSHSLYIRGRGASHPSSDIAVQFDDVPRYGALFGQVLGDSMPLSSISSVEIYKNPQPSRFGSGYAMVNVVPKYMTEEGFSGTTRFMGGSYETFTDNVAAGYKQGVFDIYIAQSWASTHGHEDHSRSQQQSYYANLGLSFSDNWNLRFLANYVDGQTLAPWPNPSPSAHNSISWPMAERFDTETYFYTLTLNNEYEKAHGYIKTFLNETTFDLLNELTNGRRRIPDVWSRQEIMVYGVRGKEAMNLWPGGEIVAGFDYDLTQLKNTQEAFDGSLAPNVWNFPNQELLAPYIALSQEFGAADGFHFIPSGGVRYYLHNEFDDKFSPQGGVVLGYAHTDLNFNYAKGVNYPSPVILQGLIQNNSSLYDFKDIKPEVVDHYELGLTHAWPGLATVGVTAFYDKGKDRVRTYFGGPAPSYFNYSANRYEIQGLELSGTVTPWPGLEFFAGFTWLDVEATGEDGIERDHMPYTPKYAVQAGFNWRFLKHLRLNVDTQFMSDVYQGTNMRTGGNYGDLGDQDKLDDIWLVNLRLGYSFEFKPMLVKQGEIYLAVDNLFDRDYAYASGYDMPGTTFMVGLDLNF